MNKKSILLFSSLSIVVVTTLSFLILTTNHTSGPHLTELNSSRCNISVYMDNSLNKMESLDNNLIVSYCIQKPTPCDTLKTVISQDGANITILFDTAGGTAGCIAAVDYELKHIRFGPLDNALYNVIVIYNARMPLILGSGTIFVNNEYRQIPLQSSVKV